MGRWDLRSEMEATMGGEMGFLRSGMEAGMDGEMGFVDRGWNG